MEAGRGNIKCSIFTAINVAKIFLLAKTFTHKAIIKIIKCHVLMLSEKANCIGHGHVNCKRDILTL